MMNWTICVCGFVDDGKNNKKMRWLLFPIDCLRDEFHDLMEKNSHFLFNKEPKILISLHT
jgi:hypothetical protein